ncbi:hypothetical protein A2419_03320 [Candidatus Adlerbacteria bacterium RIFOXYC1_FULL_48_26]|uniref:DUF5666 domain-containing protein n=1 Tax=Candidatus Adlerbacteria bacterium RIFOXYC1_FULL_48_26 TaxID=1797247 RepID=A0A1F4Y494_9BACT|nr:MAG: hypothetical protein A2419_03320 [Candidatus Adlerbacteria bacterium RIFOXYC1_FULL_48_26]OGC95000.1 MAG: hypothetical protein A2590_00925 [Candidatus Adlerbacteria bacterium RIFOXYD1_FULL_48_8]
MKKLNYFLASSAAALLLVASPMLASAHNDGDKSWKSGDNAKTELSWKNSINFLLHGGTAPQPPAAPTSGDIRISATVTAINGSTLTVTAKNNTTYTVNAANAEIKGEGDTNATIGQMKVGDTVTVKGTVNGSVITAEKVSNSALRVRAVLAANGAVGAGVVTSVNGSTFTIKPYGTKATTTVTADSSTVYRVNGEATTSAAIAVGSNVVLAGNTNSDTSIAATIVGIFSRGFGFFKHALFH